jgi:F-type H+-transporting ATPase subunit a
MQPSDRQVTGVTAENWKLAQAEQTAPASDSAQDQSAPAGGDEIGHGVVQPGADPDAAAHGAGQAAAEHGGGHGTGGIDPMHQFEIKRFIDLRDYGLDFLSFTNSSLFMLIAVGGVTAFFVYAMRGHSLVPTRIQSVAEVAYEFVAKMVRDNSGTEGMKFFPFIFSLFIFILALNMLGMIPYSITVTSHIVVTFALAMMVFLVVTIVGFVKNGVGFLRLFVPSGAPVLLMPILIPIELISFLIRPISLSVRLFANMMAGHMMLKVFAGFVVALGVAGIAPLLFMVAFTGLEILVAFLQAFVFAVLTCIYLNDALHMHH